MARESYPSGSSLVTPGSSTDNAVVRWDGTTGLAVQNSLLTISDVGAIALTSSGANDATFSLTSLQDAAIYLIADTDDVTEDHNAFVKYSQDGAAVIAWAGITGTINTLPDATALTGVQANDFVLGHSLGINGGVTILTRIASATVFSWQVNSTTAKQTFQCLAAGAEFTGASSGADTPFNWFNTATTASSTVTHFIGANATTLGFSISHDNNAGAATINHYSGAGNFVIQTKQSIVMGIDSNNDSTNATFTIQKDAATDVWQIGENGSIQHTIAATSGTSSTAANSLTTGNIKAYSSSSSSSSTRTLFSINNSNASSTGTTVFNLINASTNLTLAIGNAAFTQRTPGGTAPQIQIEGTTLNATSMSQTCNANDATSAPYRFFVKSRGTSVNSNTVVQSGDVLGGIVFAGTDGTAPIAAAGIYGYVDGTPGTNDMPGRIEFHTTADGAASPTKRVIINNAGAVTLGTVDGTGTGAFNCGVLSITNTVSASVATPSTHKVTISIGGSTYYLLASDV